LPAIVVCLVFAGSISAGSDAIDFRPFYRAAEDVLAGRNPYPGSDALLTASGHPYVYPPLPALASAPLTALPVGIASALVMAVLVLVALAIPFALGVRDWRCYGAVLLWPPVLSAIQTGNVTLWLALAAAVCWRFRERVLAGGAVLGAALAVKFLLWPLVVWLAAARRFASAALAVVGGAGLLLASWAAIGFDGFTGYPDLLRRLNDAVGDDAYTASNLARDLGAPFAVAHVLWLAIGIGLLAGCVVVARVGHERSAFLLALAASLALSPLVWLHYFALLIVAVAVSRPRLGFVWFVPVALVVTPGVGDPTPAQTAVALTVVGATFALALRETRRDEREGGRLLIEVPV
jgi:Glycosyltransferase family 87